MERMDLHVHTKYSDGSATVQEAIQAAKERSLAYIAITDHFTTTWKRAVIRTINHKKFEKYCEEIRRERDIAESKCLIGIEIDVKSKWKQLMSIPFHNFEIILFEYVNSIVLLKDLASLIREANIQAIVALAHNSYFQRANIELLGQILVENDIYFELNSRYMDYYDEDAMRKLRILKELRVKFTIGSDSHSIRRIGDTERSLRILRAIDGFDSLINLNHIRL